MKVKKYLITPKNKLILSEFIDWLKANITDDPDTIRNNETGIRKILYLLKKDLSKVKNQDLDKVFANIPDPGTRELNKITFKRFLRIKGFNELSDHIKINSKYFKESSKTANDVLSEEEINQVRNSENSNRDLAIFELFCTTGIRREELSTLKVQNIHVLKDEIKVDITESKTVPRSISIIPYPGNSIAFYPKHFVSYYNNHPYKNQNNKPLFYSGDYRRPGMEFEVHAINQIIHKVGKKAKLTKKITPHILRHTAATYDGYHLTEQNLMLKYGWKSSEMARKYCHLNEEQFNDFLKQKAGLTPQIVDLESKCPYCGQINNINALNCINCKRTINKDEMAKQQQAQEEREQKMKDLLENTNMELKNLSKQLEELETDSNASKLTSFFILSQIPIDRSIPVTKEQREKGQKKIEEFLKKCYTIKDEQGNTIMNNQLIQVFKQNLHELELFGY